jgi:hypothetical protein
MGASRIERSEDEIGDVYVLGRFAMREARSSCFRWLEDIL